MGFWYRFKVGRLERVIVFNDLLAEFYTFVAYVNSGPGYKTLYLALALPAE